MERRNFLTAAALSIGGFSLGCNDRLKTDNQVFERFNFTNSHL